MLTAFCAGKVFSCVGIFCLASWVFIGQLCPSADDIDDQTGNREIVSAGGPTCIGSKVGPIPSIKHQHKTMPAQNPLPGPPPIIQSIPGSLTMTESEEWLLNPPGRKGKPVAWDLLNSRKRMTSGKKQIIVHKCWLKKYTDKRARAFEQTVMRYKTRTTGLDTEFEVANQNKTIKDKAGRADSSKTFKIRSITFGLYCETGQEGETIQKWIKKPYFMVAKMNTEEVYDRPGEIKTRVLVLWKSQPAKESAQITDEGVKILRQIIRLLFRSADGGWPDEKTRYSKFKEFMCNDNAQKYKGKHDSALFKERKLTWHMVKDKLFPNLIGKMEKPKSCEVPVTPEEKEFMNFKRRRLSISAPFIGLQNSIIQAERE